MTTGSKVAIFLKGYPRLSETFIAQEILGLQKAGLDLELVSLRHPTDTKRHPVHEEIKAPVKYLPEYVHDEPMRCLKAWWKARRMSGTGQCCAPKTASTEKTRKGWWLAAVGVDVSLLHAELISAG